MSELKYILILRAVSLVRVRFIVQSLQFITRTSGLPAQIITQLNRALTGDIARKIKIYFLNAKCNGIMQN